MILSNASLLKVVLESSASCYKKEQRYELFNFLYDKTLGMKYRDNEVSRYSVSRQFLRAIGRTDSVEIPDERICPAREATSRTYFSYFRRRNRIDSASVRP